MKWLLRNAVWALSLFAAAVIAPRLTAEDQIPWARSLEEAQQAAGEQRKLVLLHFYNDRCPPCERLEQTVFNQPQVAQAIAQNYIPVKVHAGQQPRVAQHYQIDRWPADVLCTPAGLVVHRTISPKTADEYIALCNGIAEQTGVGAARHWVSSMQAAGQQVYDERTAQALAAGTQLADRAQATANQAAAAGQGYVAQANAAATDVAQQADQRVNTAAQQANQAAQQAHGAATNWSRQLVDTSRQLTGAGQQLGQTFENTTRGVRDTWDPTGLRGPQPASPQFNPLAAAQPAAAPTTSIYAAAQPQEQPAAQPFLPTSNPWTSGETAAQRPTHEQPIAAAPAQASAAGSESAASPSDRQLVAASQAPPIALEGYCPVTLLDSVKWTKADARYGAIHRGRTYLFASQAQQQKFLANPDAYSPVLSGYDPVLFAQRGETVAGSRAFGLKYNKQIYLFVSEESLQAFKASPQTFADTARTAMQHAVSGTQYR